MNAETGSELRTQANDSLPQPSWSDVLKNLLFIAVAIGIAYFVTVHIGLEGLREKVETAGIYAPIIILILKATTIIVAPLGGTPLYPIAGALFGFWYALGLTLLGDFIGSTIAFYISRKFGRTVLHFFMTKTQTPTVEKVVGRLGEVKSFIKARIFFAGFMDLFAYAAGLSTINYWLFIVVHIIVHAAPASLAVIFGDLLVSGNWKAVIIAGVGSSILAAAGVWWFHADLAKSA